MKVEIRDEFIKLGQAMKLAGLVEVTVNGETETRRGKKLVPGDHFSWNGNDVEICSSSVK